MKTLIQRNKLATAMLVLVFITVMPVYTAAAGDEQSLRRGGVEDMTPQQKYSSAIREAGGAYKESLRECAQIAGEDRRQCAREAKATYDRDMADAKLLLRATR